MADGEEKGYIEQLTDMWTEDSWIYDEVNEETAKRKEVEDSFSYFDEVLKGLQPNTSDPGVMIAKDIGESLISNPQRWKNGKTPSSYSGLKYPAGMVEAAEMAASMLGVPSEWILSQFINETRQGSSWSKRANHFNFGAMTPTKKDRSYATRSKERVNGQLVWRPTRWAMYDSPAHFAQEYANRIKRLWPKAVGAKTLDAYIEGLAPYGDGARGNYFTEYIRKYKVALGNIVKRVSKA